VSGDTWRMYKGTIALSQAGHMGDLTLVRDTNGTVIHTVQHSNLDLWSFRALATLCCINNMTLIQTIDDILRKVMLVHRPAPPRCRCTSELHADVNDGRRWTAEPLISVACFHSVARIHLHPLSSPQSASPSRLIAFHHYSILHFTSPSHQNEYPLTWTRNHEQNSRDHATHHSHIQRRHR
jgi:hypothetical protein